MKITNLLMPTSQYKLKCPRTTQKKKIIVHNTDNSASAMAEISYMIGNSNSVSFHAAVDENRVVIGIPDERNSWNCGDGSNGFGNNYGYSIEICRNKLTADHEKFLQAEKNAAEFVAYKVNQFGLTINDVTQHYDYNGKNCPSKTRRLGWARFLKMVEAELKAYEAIEKPVEIPQDVPKPAPADPQPSPTEDRLNGPYTNEAGERLWFRVVADSNRSREVATNLVNALRERGYKGAWLQAVTLPDGLWFRSIAGSHTTRGPAEAEVALLRQSGMRGAWLQSVFVKDTASS